LKLEQLDVDRVDPAQRSNLITDEAPPSGVQLRWRHVRDDERAQKLAPGVSAVPGDHGATIAANGVRVGKSLVPAGASGIMAGGDSLGAPTA
jgi:hypothetical protein